MNCPKCDFENSENNRYCGGCGVMLAGPPDQHSGDLGLETVLKQHFTPETARKILAHSEKKIISLMGILNRITTSLDLDATLKSIMDEAKNLINSESSSLL